MGETSKTKRTVPSSVAKVVKKINEVKTRIDSVKELYGFDLSKAKSNLVDIITDFLNDMSDDNPLNGYCDRLCEPEFEAYDIVLNGLITEASKYASELEESLINTSSLRIAINRAKRQRGRAKSYFFTEKRLDEGITLLKEEVENLSNAKSDMEARETEEKRKISFKLVEIYIGFFLGLLVPYSYYIVVYLKANPLDPNLLLGFGIIYFIGCVLIYSAIGAIAKVRLPKKGRVNEEKA